MPLSAPAEAPRTGEEPFGGKIAFSTKDSIAQWPGPVKAPEGAPNVVVILLDDVGFGATSTFGGAVGTPALDALASQGLRYNNFHTTALCSPTRASLLTGLNPHRAGFGTVMESASGFPGYMGLWNKNTVSLAEVLRRNGYSTAAFGKWHNTPYREVTPVGPFDRWPTSLGFEYFYGFMVGKTSQWEPPLFRNTIAVEPSGTAEEGYHFTTDIADEAIRWVRTHESLAPGKPYFLYFATGAAHSPHHVPKAWIDRYRGRFDQGWDRLREQTFARQKQLGVVPANTELTPRPKDLPAWSTLSADEKKLYVRQMEVYAGFLAHTDHEIGRMVQTVQSAPGGDNTLILYIVGDNGSSGEGGLSGRDVPFASSLQERLEHLDELGGPLYENRYAAGWAWADSTPFQWMKQVASHFGGTRNPLVAVWPARIKERGGLRSRFQYVNDVAPTVYAATGVPFPASVDGVQQLPLDGVSFADTFTRADMPTPNRVQYFEMMGNRAIYADGWVAAARHAAPWEFPRSEDFSQDRWELYHVAEDFSQAHDLAARYPQKLTELRLLFDHEARVNNVYPLNNAFGGKQFGSEQPSFNGSRREFEYYPGLPRLATMPGGPAPDFQQSHRITANVLIPQGGAQGVILSKGWRGGGFVLYVKDNRLVYESNVGGKTRTLTSEPLPQGRVEFAFEFARNQAPPDGERTNRQNSKGRSVGSLYVNDAGVGFLYVNQRLVAQAELTQMTSSSDYMGSFNVGLARGSPVSTTYAAPFAFTGTIEKIRVELEQAEQGE